MTIWLFAAPPPTSEVVKNSALTGGNGFIQLYSSPDATPPTITSVRVVTHGKLASALVVGFSKPMAPATVENIHNYRILSPTRTIHHGSFLFGLFGGGALGSDTTETQSFPIAAATYDPSTATVTLALKRRVKASSLHEISSAYPIGGHELTSLEGQPTEEFTVLVYSVNTFDPFVPHSLKTTTEAGFGGL